MRLGKTLATLVGATLATSVAAEERPLGYYDVENLGKVNMRRKNINVQFEAKAPMFKEHEDEIKKYVVGFFSEYNIRASFVDEGVPLAHDSVKISGLGLEEYKDYVEGWSSYDEGDLGIAYYVKRTGAIVENSLPSTRRGGSLCEYSLDSAGEFFGRVVTHEILHLFGLYHPSAVENSKIPKFEMGPRGNVLLNIMKEDDFECEATLPLLQRKQLHDYLAKGVVYELMEEGKAEKNPYSWSSEQISLAKAQAP